MNNTITVIFPKDKKNKITKQFLNILELGIFDKSIKNFSLEIKFFENTSDFESIVNNSQNEGKIYIGPIDNSTTKISQKFCDDGATFFSFSSNVKLAKDCVYLVNFFPKNELEQLFSYLDEGSKVALLYPENEYGYYINSLIDNVINDSNAILINRASYKNDLSNVRDAIKELGKYELRKYELSRQKKILSKKTDNKSIKRLKILEKFRTTSDYDFSHILLADYGLNLLQVAPLLPFYDIDPNIVQFMGTGVMDDDNFFSEPSLNGAIFPGVQKNKRRKLIEKYYNIYDDNFMRVSTLPYDLIGLLSFIYENNLSFNEFYELLNNKLTKFEGVDGNFYFKNNIMERDLQILKINSGGTKTVN